MLPPKDRSQKMKSLLQTMQHDLQTNLLGPDAGTNRGISRVQSSEKPVQVSSVQERVLNQEAKYIEFLILAYIFKAKDILTTFLLGYAQNPSLFDHERPFTLSQQKQLDE